jgi:hypothetical protein
MPDGQPDRYDNRCPQGRRGDESPEEFAIAEADPVSSTPLPSKIRMPVPIATATAHRTKRTPATPAVMSFAPKTRRRSGVANSVGTIDPYRNSS